MAYFYAGLSKRGLGYFGKYIQPTPILLPINILEDFTKPLSLSFRYFGNILVDKLVVVVLILFSTFSGSYTFHVPWIIYKWYSSSYFCNFSRDLYRRIHGRLSLINFFKILVY
ncbi:hypothetical protein GIB67_016441 [Kingdonia uniflora]|uniref:Uncharacterized protein n=1 Tax=Kingdonia uniflora TaxID=39325 RepID=A0A7J7MGZ6_9MAGN|nr:hypothetical protein GIB67_016441 [Kingdonia uniflora]